MKKEGFFPPEWVKDNLQIQEFPGIPKKIHKEKCTPKRVTIKFNTKENLKRREKHKD